MTHTQENRKAKQFDGRGAMRMKRYYQVLYDLGTCLRYTTSIPSQEPVKFYDLLLRHVRVEPGQSDKQLALILHKDKKKHQEDPDPLPIAYVPPGALEYDDDEGMMVASGLMVAPKAKAKASGGSSRRNRGDGGGEPEPDRPFK